MRKRNTAPAMVLFILLVILLLIVALVGVAHAEEPVRTARQDALHDAADILRAAGYAEDSPAIRALGEAWMQEQEALDILAKVCANEATGVPGAQWCPVWHQAAVMQGVVNRTRLEGFPNTIRDVVTQVLPSGYYAYNPTYAYNFTGIDRHYYEVAKLVLDGDAAELYDIPADLVFHDNAPHGPVWKTSCIDTGWYRSTTYFCTIGG